MRALQMDPKHGNPQRWAQNCFFLCTYSIIVQTCVAVFVPLILGGEVKQGRAAGDVVVEQVDMMGGYLAKGLSVLRFLVMLGVYAGALAVVCAVFTMEHPDGKEHTIPVSPTMQCVVNLAFQYFFIYILLWIFITVEDFTDMDLEFVRDAIETAKSTVQFAPMLCSVHRHAHPCVADHGQQGCPAGLGSGWYVHGFVVPAGAVPDVLDHADLHWEDVHHGLPGWVEDGGQGADLEPDWCLDRDDHALLGSHWPVCWYHPCGVRCVDDDAGDGERPRVGPAPW